MSDSFNENVATSEEAEFVRLLTEHQDSIRAYIISLLPGCSEALDVLQETNMVIWNKRDQFQPGTNFKAWTFAIARFSVMNFRNKLRRNGRIIFGDELLDQLAIPQEELVPEKLATRREALATCMSKLSSEQRQIIHNRYTKGLSLEDYAARTNKTAGALRISLFRLRANLRDCINQRLSSSYDLSPS